MASGALALQIFQPPFKIDAAQAVDADYLVAAGDTGDDFNLPYTNAEPVGEHFRHGVVGAAVFGRRGNTDLYRVAESANDGIAFGARLDADGECQRWGSWYGHLASDATRRVMNSRNCGIFALSTRSNPRSELAATAASAAYQYINGRLWSVASSAWATSASRTGHRCA